MNKAFSSVNKSLITDYSLFIKIMTSFNSLTLPRPSNCSLDNVDLKLVELKDCSYIMARINIFPYKFVTVVPHPFFPK